MSNQSSKPSIVISLNESTNATSTFEDHNLIQHKSYEKIQSIFTQNISLLDKYEKEDKNIELCKIKFPHRHHEAITILGERGSGKTSFLLNLENKLHNSKHFSHSNKLSFLRILDPTLFENKQHVMLTIITTILNKVSGTKAKNNDKKDNYEKCLNNLASGINLLDGIDSKINHKSIWDDSRINFNKGIDSSKSGISFEEDFKRFIKSSLEYIDKKIFVLIFDDIDTNIEKGWPVLEVIRKYLTTLEIQVIVSGDWELFSKLVRVNQFKNLNGLKDIEEECDCNKGYGYLKTLDVLEEQYLTKILKPENRIMLQNLQSLTRDINLYITENNDINEEQLYETSNSLESRYIQLLSYALGTNKQSELENFKQIFFLLPLRSNIQLLSTYFKNKNNNLDFIDDLGKQFLTKLTRFGITYQDLSEFKEDTGIYYYIKKSLELSRLYNSINFYDFLQLGAIEVSEDKDKNILLFVFKSYLTGLINYRPHLSIDWILKIELFKQYYISDSLEVENDLKYLGFGLPTTSLQFARKLNGWLLAKDNINSEAKGNYINGYVKVYKDQSKMGKDSYDYFIKQIDKLKDKNSYYFISTFLFNKISLERESKFDLFGSIYFIIGLVSELISLNAKEGSIKEHFTGKGMLSSLVVYSSENNSSSINYEEEYPSYIFDNKLVLKLEKWLKRKNNIENFSIDLLENTMDEFIKLESELPETDNFATYITLQITYFLNALLGSELKNDSSSSKKTLKRIKNINKAIEILNQNINKSNILNKNIDNKITFFEFIYSCPIWEYLIDLKVLNQEDNIIAIEPEEEVDTSSLFYTAYGEAAKQVKPEPKLENLNSFIGLLEGLKTHQLKVKKTYKYDKDTLVAIFKENQNKFKEHIFLEANDSLNTDILNEYIQVLKNYFPSGSKYTTANKKKTLIDAIIEFNQY